MPSQVSDIELENTSGQDALLASAKDGTMVAAANGDGVTTRMLEDEVQVGILETETERKARKMSHRILYITTFVMAIGFSIVLTGVWPYLQQLDPSVSKEFLGWVVAANPLGQMLASPLLGLWANKSESNRIVFISTIVCFIVGNIFYSILGAFGSASKTMMIVSRFTVGLSSANMAVVRSYIAESTTLSERTTGVSLIAAAQALGFIVGPAAQTGLVALFSRPDKSENQGENSTASMQNSSALQPALAAAFNPYEIESTNLTMNIDNTFVDIQQQEAKGEYISVVWNMYTATGWFAAALGLVNVFLFLPCLYQEYPIAAKEAQLQRRDGNESELELLKPDYLMLIVCLVILFVIVGIYVLLETIMVPMTMDMYAWSDKHAITVIGIGLSIGAVLSVMMFSMVGFLSKRMDERKILIFIGLVPMTLSALCFFPMGSTYPKMQNCTLDPDHVIHSPEDFSKLTTIIPDLVMKENELMNNQAEDIKPTFDILGNFTENVLITTGPTIDELTKDGILTTETLIRALTEDVKHTPETSLRQLFKDGNPTTETPMTSLTEEVIHTAETSLKQQTKDGIPTTETPIEKLTEDVILNDETTLGKLTVDGFYTTETPFEILTTDVDNLNSSLFPVHSSADDFSNHNTLSRRRRHATVKSGCHDRGCPQEQTWCLYTPIIELPQLAIASVIAVLGYPMSLTILSSMFSKLLGPKPQGVWMGFLTSTASFSRVVGPIAVTYIYTKLGTRWTFGILFFMLMITVLLASVFFQRLVPMKVTRTLDSNS